MSFESPNSQEISEKPTPCEGDGCPFYGTAAKMNLCSVCYKEKMKENKTNESDKVEPLPDESVLKSETRLKEEKLVEDVGDDESESSPTEKNVSLDISPSPRKVQEDTRKCFHCNKFVGFRGIKCKCGYVYCSTHRFYENHNCDFDFAAHERGKLQKFKNKAVIADKLEGERL